ncbi:MAG: BACON domain-containing protein [Desulfosarcina sp.]|nr:BACON domain-containing protein [Desulfosarcina sp.]
MVDRDYTGRLAAILSTGTIFNSHLREKNREISCAKTHTFFRISIRDFFFASMIFLLCISLLWGCGNDVQGVSTAGYSDTGSASLTIRWHDTQYFQNSTAVQTSLNCQASGIEHVVCNVYDTSTGTLLVTGGPWDCEAHSGTIKGIPVGQDRTFVLWAEDFNGNMKWRGEVTGVTIIAGKNNENVSVEAYRFIPSLIFPNNGDIVDPNAISLEWEPCFNAVEYIVQVATDEDFYDIIIDQTTPGLTYEPAILTPSTEYYWKISGIDLYANIGAESETRHFITSDCTYSISSTNNTISSGGGTGRFYVSTSSTSCEWYAETNATWVTITSESSGIGDGTVTYTVSPNTGASRTAVINIAGQTHTVNQESAGCTYNISPTSRKVASTGGSYDVAVTASQSYCAWSASENSSWISITPTTGSGDGSVRVTVSPNTGASRTAVINIAGQTHTVSQDPALGSLKVTIYPSEAVSAGARWRVDGGDWNSSGYTQNGLSVGNHLLEFNTIPGWIKPTNQTVTISNNQTTDTSVEYSQHTVIDLSVYAYKIKNYKYADLTWSGANSTSVDVYRDGSIIATTPNDGAYTHGPFSEGPPATYQTCEAGTSICSNMVPVSW